MTITPGIVSDWVLEVAAYTDGTEPAGGYTQVKGITNYTPPGISKDRQDDSDFDSGAFASQVATGLSYELTGTCKIPRAGMTADPGQEILRTAGMNVAEDGRVHFRTYKRGAATGLAGVIDANFTEGGGSRTDLTTAEFGGPGVGAVVVYTVPVTP
jgi:hypothetical protein